MYICTQYMYYDKRSCSLYNIMLPTENIQFHNNMEKIYIPVQVHII